MEVNTHRSTCAPKRHQFLQLPGLIFLQFQYLRKVDGPVIAFASTSLSLIKHPHLPASFPSIEHNNRRTPPRFIMAFVDPVPLTKCVLRLLVEMIQWLFKPLVVEIERLQVLVRLSTEVESCLRRVVRNKTEIVLSSSGMSVNSP